MKKLWDPQKSKVWNRKKPGFVGLGAPESYVDYVVTHAHPADVQRLVHLLDSRHRAFELCRLKRSAAALFSIQHKVQSRQGRNDENRSLKTLKLDGCEQDWDKRKPVGLQWNIIQIHTVSTQLTQNSSTALNGRISSNQHRRTSGFGSILQLRFKLNGIGWSTSAICHGLKVLRASGSGCTWTKWTNLCRNYRSLGKNWKQHILSHLLVTKPSLLTFRIFFLKGWSMGVTTFWTWQHVAGNFPFSGHTVIPLWVGH